jgi:hypothetical protein
MAVLDIGWVIQKHFPHPRPFSRREKGEKPLALRERGWVREVFDVNLSD